LKTLQGHVNILQLFDAFSSVCSPIRWQVLLVTERCQESLRDWCWQHPNVPIPLVTAWTRDLLRGLAFCHANRVLHRDIKKSNLLLSLSGGDQNAFVLTLTIADFGSSIQLTRASPGHGGEIQESFRTTDVYASPEALRGEQCRFSSDVWSAGIVIRELLQEDSFREAVEPSAPYTPADVLKLLPDVLEATQAMSEEMRKCKVLSQEWISVSIRFCFCCCCFKQCGL